MTLGFCSECGRTVFVQENGFCEQHTVWHGGSEFACSGSGKPPDEDNSDLYDWLKEDDNA
jgi:hypothetical protein